ncbi:MAG: hypothetical protein V5A27_08545 [Halapricum sp.]
MTQQVESVGSINREQIVEAVVEDPHRKPFEKESRILWSKDGDHVEFYSTNAGEMRRLLQHPEFDLDWLEVSLPDNPRRTVAINASELPVDFEDRGVYAVEGTLPVGCVLVKRDPRTSGSHADTITSSVLREDP